jgi:hypothetical protein
MERAAQKVQARLERTVATLEKAGVPYAIIGGFAVRAWVAQVDEAAVRTTRDVDILLCRADLPAVSEAMRQAGFVQRCVKGVDVFLDAADAKDRDAVHFMVAGETNCADNSPAVRDVLQTEAINGLRVLRLNALVRMKLTSFRCKDRMHLLDMIDVELIDRSWCDRLPSELAARLQELLDNPDG